MEQQTWLTRIALRCCDWSERWFPDAYVFAALGVVAVGLLAAVIGVSPAATAYAFGDGFWSLIPFTSLNTYNFLFLILGLLLNWNPRRFLDAVARAVPSATGVLIQFPLYGGIASILTSAKVADGHSLAQQLSAFFTHIATADSFPMVMGVYSAVLGP